MPPRYQTGCNVEGCFKLFWSKGLCRFHDNRRRQGIDLNAPSVVSKGWTHKGYRWIMVDGKEVMEHREVMKKFLGRELLYDEVVHHINEDKLDNAIENLEIKRRDIHTSEHRAHQTPCVVCGITDSHGTRGRCAKHHSQMLRDIRKLTLP